MSNMSVISHGLVFYVHFWTWIISFWLAFDFNSYLNGNWIIILFTFVPMIWEHKSLYDIILSLFNFYGSCGNFYKLSLVGASVFGLCIGYIISNLIDNLIISA